VFILAMLVGPSAHMEQLIPTRRIYDKTDCVDFSKTSIDMFPLRLKGGQNYNTLLGDNVVWLLAV
jgi:hypothetical protein